MSSEPAQSDNMKAWSQWVTIYLQNKGNKDIMINHINLSYGHLYEGSDKDNEVPPTKYENRIISPGDELKLQACGKWGSNTGTTGEFDLIDIAENYKRIRHFYFDSPYNSSMNTWTISGTNDEWMTNDWGANLGPGGTLGSITCQVMNISEVAEKLQGIATDRWCYIPDQGILDFSSAGNLTRDVATSFHVLLFFVCIIWHC